MTPNLPNAVTPTGMVHLGRMARNPWGGGHSELYPACTGGRRDIREVSPTDQPVTCRRCLAKLRPHD